MRKPSRAASSAVARTQWSVAMPTTSTSVTSRARSQSASVDAVLVGALEAAVRRRVRALVEDRVDRAGGDRRGEVRVEADALRAGDAVRAARSARSRGCRRSGRPGRCGGRGWRRRGGSRRRRLPDQLGDGGGDIGTARHREAAALAEVVLHVYDDQVRGAWRVSFGGTWGRAGPSRCGVSRYRRPRDFGVAEREGAFGRLRTPDARSGIRRDPVRLPGSPGVTRTPSE